MLVDKGDQRLSGVGKGGSHDQGEREVVCVEALHNDQ